MKFFLNNRKEAAEADSLSVSDLLELKKYTFRMRIIKINGTLISKDEYESTIIHEGDNVQILYLMSGG
jgi:thiamine biosynthesis protein ThiS